jgi:MYXO-CTERM domain-containing protein
MTQGKMSFSTGAERAALVAGIAGAVGLLSSGQAEASPVVNSTAGGSAVVTYFGASASNKWIGIDLLDTNGPGLGNGADILFNEALGVFGATIDLGTISGSGAFGYFAIDPTTIAGMYRLHRFTSPTQVSSFTGVFTVMYSYGAVFSSASTGGWVGNTGYIGFRLADGSGYGWVELQVDNATGPVTVLSWSPESADNGVDKNNLTGTGTPEPAAAGLGLLALGAAGVLRHKRRRRDS